MPGQHVSVARALWGLVAAGVIVTSTHGCSSGPRDFRPSSGGDGGVPGAGGRNEVPGGGADNDGGADAATAGANAATGGASAATGGAGGEGNGRTTGGAGGADNEGGAAGQGCTDAACEDRCEPGSTRCAGNAVMTCQPGGVFGDAVTCPAARPVCGGSGVCLNQRSCVGLPWTCGSNKDASCCESALVPGGTFNRDNNPSYPATISDFRLDVYEITVGRFRRFAEAYAPDMIQAGAGKNPNNPADPGWDPAWNAQLPADKDALVSAGTWLGDDDNRPINYVSWYVLNAFCAWDGGRLPTEAEWNYAAAGGAEQRLYPWGDRVPGNDAVLSIHGCYYNGAGVCDAENWGNIAPVGSAPAGNARWGHSDLSGNLFEFVYDSSATYAVPCVDCAALAGTSRIIRGGAYFHPAGTTVQRTTAIGPHQAFGARCARAP